VKMIITTLDRHRLAARRFDDEMAVFDVQARVVHKMNSTASHLWEALAGGATYDELVRGLCDAFDVDVACAERDVTAFIESLESAGLVKTH
jgi:Coenzyme PQQ synthesis protein D (PqqD)